MERRVGEREKRSLGGEVAGDVLWGCGATVVTLGAIVVLAGVGLAVGLAGLVTGLAVLVGSGVGLASLGVAAGLVYFGGLASGDGDVFLSAMPTADDAIDRRFGGVPIAIAGGLGVVFSGLIVGFAWRFSPSAIGVMGSLMALMPGVIAVVAGVLRAMANARHDAERIREAAAARGR